MDKELNEKLKVGLTKNLGEYLPQCKESLVRNKHMHDFKGVEFWNPKLDFAELVLVIGQVVEDFACAYEGGDRLGDVVDALCAAAKKCRKTRSGELDDTLWDAAVVDFINFWAGKRGMDLGLYARDLSAGCLMSNMGMTTYELYTEFRDYVATVEVPIFLPAPDVLIWGNRFFRALKEAVNDVPGGRTQGKPWAYIECFAYASMTESPGLPRWEPPAIPPVDRDARDVVGEAAAPGEPDTTLKEDGQQAGYVVLSAEERAKGFVRPVRNSYTHVGEKICGRTDSEPAPLLPDEVGWLCTLAPAHEGSCCFSAVTAPQLHTFNKRGTLNGCLYVTSMGRELAETYARDPGFYNGTYCSKCKAHFPTGADGEFEWLGENTKVGT